MKKTLCILSLVLIVGIGISLSGSRNTQTNLAKSNIEANSVSAGYIECMGTNSVTCTIEYNGSTLVTTGPAITKL